MTVQHFNLQTSAGRQSLRWLRLNCPNLCFCSVEFETDLPERNHQFIKHIAKLFGTPCKHKMSSAWRRSNTGGRPSPFFLKHHIAKLPPLIALLNTISEDLKHTLVACHPWCKIHGSHPSVHWFVLLVLFFFFLAPFFCKVSVLDCCTGQSPGNEMIVLLVSLQATRGEGGQIQAMLLKRGLGFGWGQRAHVACGRGFRCVVGGSHPRCCGRRCPRITSLLQGRLVSQHKNRVVHTVSMLVSCHINVTRSLQNPQNRPGITFFQAWCCGPFLGLANIEPIYLRAKNFESIPRMKSHVDGHWTKITPQNNKNGRPSSYENYLAKPCQYLTCVGPTKGRPHKSTFQVKISCLLWGVRQFRATLKQQLTYMEPVRTTTWSFFLDHYLEVFNFYPGWCRVPANSAPATLSRGPFQKVVWPKSLVISLHFWRWFQETKLTWSLVLQ